MTEMSEKRASELRALCLSFRRDVLTAIHAAQSGHPGGSLSVCEILTVLYFEKMNVFPDRPDAPGRDRLVLGKGHAAPMLYRVLAEKGFFPVSEMAALRQVGSRLQGHPSVYTPGVDMPSGPLGIGLSAAQGMALGQRLAENGARTYAVLGDGELNEGNVWETAMSAVKFGLDNLTAILDYNRVQLDGCCDEIMPMGDVAAKWRAFGWDVFACDGHDVAALSDAIERANVRSGRPAVVIAHTIKGKGVSFMEGRNTWHGKQISDAEYSAAMAELGGAI